MIIRNEKDLFNLWRKLTKAKKPFVARIAERVDIELYPNYCEEQIAAFEYNIKNLYLQELGENPGGYESEDHW